ncbi:hypothetical protein L484_000666 [Morus notabilis]|uniref:Uncharacterized protein n=1 Tax=Morus notabilis TaxID=981085 RepID=W9SP58_9ROSA|nr:hypothetical protein L484_000666 [Morus notabilis]
MNKNLEQNNERNQWRSKQEESDNKIEAIREQMQDFSQNQAKETNQRKRRKKKKKRQSD